ADGQRGARRSHRCRPQSAGGGRGSCGGASAGARPSHRPAACPLLQQHRRSGPTGGARCGGGPLRRPPGPHSLDRAGGTGRGGARVLLKVEGTNPTGSFKDRGMTVAISKAVESGAKAVVCASTGNTSASAAAYAARAGLTCAVLIPEGHIALGKLAQALVHGARVLQVPANFDAALSIVRELGERAPVTVVNSVNQHRIEGQKTAAYEVIDALGDAPDVQCIPVGNAGNITAYWKGYCEYRAAERSTRLPRMLG